MLFELNSWRTAYNHTNQEELHIRGKYTKIMLREAGQHRGSVRSPCSFCLVFYWTQRLQYKSHHLSAPKHQWKYGKIKLLNAIHQWYKCQNAKSFTFLVENGVAWTAPQLQQTGKTWGKEKVGSDLLSRCPIRQWLCRLLLLRQCYGLMIYRKIERALVKSKWIFNDTNSNFSLEMAS